MFIYIYFISMYLLLDNAFEWFVYVYKYNI